MAVKNPVPAKKAPVATKSPAPSKEATVRAKAKARGWTLEKVGAGYRLVDAVSKTRLADNWVTNDGLPLGEVEKILG